eukprot:scaffold18331_cov185-Isochrysis_galbana.AAC.1
MSGDIEPLLKAGLISTGCEKMSTSLCRSAIIGDHPFARNPAASLVLELGVLLVKLDPACRYLTKHRHCLGHVNLRRLWRHAHEHNRVRAYASLCRCNPDRRSKPGPLRAATVALVAEGKFDVATGGASPIGRSRNGVRAGGQRLPIDMKQVGRQ